MLNRKVAALTAIVFLTAALIQSVYARAIRVDSGDWDQTGFLASDSLQAIGFDFGYFGFDASIALVRANGRVELGDAAAGAVLDPFFDSNPSIFQYQVGITNANFNQPGIDAGFRVTWQAFDASGALLNEFQLTLWDLVGDQFAFEFNYNAIGTPAAQVGFDSSAGNPFDLLGALGLSFAEYQGIGADEFTACSNAPDALACNNYSFNSGQFGPGIDVLPDIAGGFFRRIDSNDVSQVGTVQGRYLFISAASDPDADDDGVPDNEDNCPDDSNSNQADLDEDGIGDVCDDDADGDEESPPLDCNDLDPSIFTGALEICSDGIDNDCDALIDDNDPEADCDGDLIPNDFDNCPNDPNPGQSDIDNDGIGDVCDDDDDNDGFSDENDNCPSIANDQSDFDLDGVGDACDSDGDGDSVDNPDDQCVATAASDTDAGVPSRRLGKNRWADVDGDGLFDTSGKNPTGRYFTIDDTGGCNCAQIIEACGYGKGHSKFGCSNSVMDWWTGKFDRDGQPAYQCEN